MWHFHSTILILYHLLEELAYLLIQSITSLILAKYIHSGSKVLCLCSIIKVIVMQN